MDSQLASAGYVGPYRIERRLGHGGMGEVYAGFDERLDRPVALKRISPGAENKDSARKRFQREARAVARLHHPAIVQIFDWVESGDGDWIVMELVQGRSLRHLLHEGPLEPGRAARLARDVLVGLAVAHAAGFVHRDLKAENVMITADSSPDKVEQAKILDFGLAKRIDPEASETRISMDGKLVGTLSAMSPEQVRGDELGPQSDFFALGSLLYEMVSGIAAFRGDSAAEILHRICTWDPPPVTSINPAVPEVLARFIGRLLAKDPRRRPRGAEEALAELDEVLAVLPTGETTRFEGFPASSFRAPAAIAPAVPPTLPRARSHGKLGWRVAAVIVVLGALVAVGSWLREPPRTLYVAVPRAGA